MTSSLTILISFSHLSSYTQEIPTRFKKEIVQAASGDANATVVGLAGVERLLANIGRADGVSPQDLQLIFTEVGTGGQIPTNRFFQMI